MMVVNYDIIYISKSQTLEQFSKDGEKTMTKDKLKKELNVFLYVKINS
jgi:hypothetical protein